MKTTNQIFSLIQNIKTFLSRKKEGYYDLDKELPQFIFDNSKPFIKNKYKNIWNEYANYYFTYDELKQYILYNYLLEPKFIAINITGKEVKQISKIFSKEQFVRDLQLVKSTVEKTGYNSIRDFFKFNEEGVNVLYILTNNKTISPMLYMEYIDEIEENKKNSNYKRFVKIIKTLKQITTEK